MKRPIDPSEIRKGDLIRWETSDENEHIRAEEWRSNHDHPPHKGWGQHYLLDRPAPPVELPTEPTLGWLEWETDPEKGLDLAEWHRFNSKIAFAGGGMSVPLDSIKSFAPATAVPTKALDELRNSDATRPTGSTAGFRRLRAVESFLAAVDEANGTAS